VFPTRMHGLGAQVTPLDTHPTNRGPCGPCQVGHPLPSAPAPALAVLSVHHEPHPPAERLRDRLCRGARERREEERRLGSRRPREDSGARRLGREKARARECSGERRLGRLLSSSLHFSCQSMMHFAQPVRLKSATRTACRARKQRRPRGRAGSGRVCACRDWQCRKWGLICEKVHSSPDCPCHSCALGALQSAGAPCPLCLQTCASSCRSCSSSPTICLKAPPTMPIRLLLLHSPADTCRNTHRSTHCSNSAAYECGVDCPGQRAGLGYIAYQSRLGLSRPKRAWPCD
jgi:hypothetical protein